MIRLFFHSTKRLFGIEGEVAVQHGTFFRGAKDDIVPQRTNRFRDYGERHSTFSGQGEMLETPWSKVTSFAWCTRASWSRMASGVWR